VGEIDVAGRTRRRCNGHTIGGRRNKLQIRFIES